MTIKLCAAFIIGFAAALITGLVFVPFLRRVKAGQSIREDGPSWHKTKAGTPTMGGVIFIVGCAAACVGVGYSAFADGDFGHLFVLAFALAFGAIGFVDDYYKLKKKQNLGLTAGKKFILQVAAATVFVFALRQFGFISPALYIPFANITVQLPEALYFIFAVFAIVATVNAVNLTDGLDGLATGTTIPVFIFFSVVAFTWGESFMARGIFSSGLAGALLAFLSFNFYPAKVFMGDTGSLFLGGAVAGMAFAMDMPLIIVTVGIIYIAEVLSDVIQVLYFKITHGKRFFKMAPFHHHLEMGGWSGKKRTEKQIFTMFTAISILMAVISYFGVFNRYGI
ncbi:MAG: phospho-N-acetylmuramoyl-pentapeptide-transferase [Oscillospiraceae bacterium]|jgi:phospho-N-acetylmuramoyl-pentapeptide-transferase|nr:phospho-N-acetylmuramoyl-pentapeptide-transferase [Oscillospiraceae bacterium]